jgi:hypothetical protein
MHTQMFILLNEVSVQLSSGLDLVSSIGYSWINLLQREKEIMISPSYVRFQSITNTDHRQADIAEYMGPNVRILWFSVGRPLAGSGSSDS